MGEVGVDKVSVDEVRVVFWGGGSVTVEVRVIVVVEDNGV